MNTRRKVMLASFVCCIIAALFFLSFAVYGWYEEYKNNKTHADIVNIYTSDQPSPSPTVLSPSPSPSAEPSAPASPEPSGPPHDPQPPFVCDWDGLKALNPDVQAWIRVPNTTIDFPVVLGTDNEYYLQHTVENTKSKFGAIFLDVRTDYETADTFVMYGHNHGAGKTTMFSQLKKYADEEFMKENPYVIYNRAYEEETVVWDVWAYAAINVDWPQVRVLYGFGDDKQEFYDTVGQFAKYVTDIDPAGKEMIILSTCNGEGNRRERALLYCVRRP